MVAGLTVVADAVNLAVRLELGESANIGPRQLGPGHQSGATQRASVGHVVSMQLPPICSC